MTSDVRDDLWDSVDELLDEAMWQDAVQRVPTLSHRELAILVQLGTGASNGTIARRLRITERTVKAHIGRILAKLRVESRLQAGLVVQVWARTGRRM